MFDKEYGDREERLTREQEEHQLSRDHETRTMQLWLDMARELEKERKMEGAVGGHE